MLRELAKPDDTARVDLAKYESLVARGSEMEHQLAQLQRDDGALRRQLSATEDRLRTAEDRLRSAMTSAADSERTTTGSQLPLTALVEHIGTLEESIDSLRANMRAASDETAMMDPSESVSTISSAVSQAA